MIWRKILTAWLQRSGTAPLDYKLVLYLHPYSANLPKDLHELCGNMLLDLMGEQKRWRSMHLVCENLSATRHQKFMLLDMPLLRSLYFRVANRDKSHRAFKYTSDVTTSPHLSQLCLSGFQDLTNAVAASRLTELSLGFDWGMPMTELRSLELCLELLQSTPSLSRLQLNLPYVANRFSLPLAPALVLRHLEHFICSRGAKLAASIIEKLTLPALKTIRVGDYAEQSVLGSYFLDLVRRSEPPLEEVHVISDFTNGTYLLPALRLLPTVKSLALDGAWLSAAFLRALTIGGTDDSFICPHLASLKLYCTGWPIRCNDLIAPMLVSRWTHMKTFEVVIKEIEPRFVDELSEHDGLQRCIEEGFAFHMKYSGDTDSECLYYNAFGDGTA